MTLKCINCRKEIEEARIRVLGRPSLCRRCAIKYETRRDGHLQGGHYEMSTVLAEAKAKKVPNSQMVFSVMREDALPRVSTPFKRVRKPTLGVIRNGALWTTLIPINRSVNRVVDDNGACSNDFSDSSCEFDTSVPRSANRNPGD